MLFPFWNIDKIEPKAVCLSAAFFIFCERPRKKLSAITKAQQHKAKKLELQ